MYTKRNTNRVTHFICISLLLASTLTVAACDDFDGTDPQFDEDTGGLDEDTGGLDEDTGGERAPALAPDELLWDEADEMEDHATAKDVTSSPQALTKHNLCCHIVFDAPFQVRVVIPNPSIFNFPAPSDCSDYFAGSHNVKYQVTHYYGNPPPFNGVTSPIPLGTTRSIELTHDGSLDAYGCTAWYEV